MRSREPGFQTPMPMIEYAERSGRMPELGRAVRELCADAAANIPRGTALFVNVHALRSLRRRALLLVEPPSPPTPTTWSSRSRERGAIDEVGDIVARMRRLRSLGYRLAIDDLGAGYAGLSSIAMLEPDFVKLDMSLTRDPSPPRRSASASCRRWSTPAATPACSSSPRASRRSTSSRSCGSSDAISSRATTSLGPARTSSKSPPDRLRSGDGLPHRKRACRAHRERRLHHRGGCRFAPRSLVDRLLAAVDALHAELSVTPAANIFEGAEHAPRLQPPRTRQGLRGGAGPRPHPPDRGERPRQGLPRLLPVLDHHPSAARSRSPSTPTTSSSPSRSRMSRWSAQHHVGAHRLHRGERRHPPRARNSQEGPLPGLRRAPRDHRGGDEEGQRPRVER